MKITDSDLATMANVSTRTIRRWKKDDIEKYNRLLRDFLKSDLFDMKKFLEDRKISLMGNHGIYFIDVNDFAVGVLAEDTNNMISSLKKSEEMIKEIDENLRLMKEWL